MFYKYLRYVLLHKWYVLYYGVAILESRGLPFWWLWQFVVHDWSKFTPAEFLGYMRFFYGPHTQVVAKSPSEARAVAPPEVALAFDVAWLLHQNRNPHHWQYWVLSKDDGTVLPLKMPTRFMWEMLADWQGAGRMFSKGKQPDTAGWYLKNRNKIVLHPDTRADVEAFLRVKN